MKGINPCPFCGGEVEMVKLPRGGKDSPWKYRIECRKCHALTARGEGFKGEPSEKARERIWQYEKIMEGPILRGINQRRQEGAV